MIAIYTHCVGCLSMKSKNVGKFVLQNSDTNSLAFF